MTKTPIKKDAKYYQNMAAKASAVEEAQKQIRQGKEALAKLRGKK